MDSQMFRRFAQLLWSITFPVKKRKVTMISTERKLVFNLAEARPASLTDRALCVHGHFYQPPREDPLTGEIPAEPGAAPYANWNERIHEECYKPNAELGNFEHISFNVGPTLFRWMADYDPVTYQRILAQDRSNVERFGVGNALAQPYHHTILPLASRRDKITQIRWGIADFEFRFGRKPEGMWLPETAVDYETLDVLAGHGIAFTIMAPWQADCPENLDVTVPYWVHTPAGNRIAVFFYHGPLSAGVSFDQGLTSNAHRFASENVAGFFDSNHHANNRHQLLLVASDGELYGHHQVFRDWFLAYLINGAGSKVGVRGSFPALWLQQHPPSGEVHLREKTSWSCHHGVARWAGDCGCLLENGAWKNYLRRAFDLLAEALDQIFEVALVSCGVADPWQLRHEYARVFLGQISEIDFIRQAVQGDFHPGDLERIRLLLQAQYERQRMYTSCAFFHGDFDRLEPKNAVRYAAQAVWLFQKATGVDLSGYVLPDLRQVVSVYSRLRADQVFSQHLQRVRAG